MESLEGIWDADGLPDYLDEEEDDSSFPSPAKAPYHNPTEQLLEEGEFCPSSSDALQLGFSPSHGEPLRFAANDLDAAVMNAKKSTRLAGKKAKKASKSKKRKGASKAKQKDDVPRICRSLKEPKVYLIEAAVERLGLDVVRDLVKEVQTIEKHGGQTTVDGRRRRTPGGVLWNVMRSRYEEDYKAIMAAGKEIEKQQRKRKFTDGGDGMAVNGMGKRKSPEDEGDAMVIDGGEQMLAAKRRRVLPPEAQVKRTGVTVWPCSSSYKRGTDFIWSKVDPDNSRALSEAQCAWAEGLKQGKPKPGQALLSDEAVKKKPASIAERLRVPIQYDDL